MTIERISSTGGIQRKTTNSASVIKSLEQKVSDIQKDIIKVQSDKNMDEKTKTQQLAVYQTQIQQLQAQISNLKQTDNSSSTAIQTSPTETSEVKDAPPPPDKMDFANISDTDLKDYLQKMKELTGIIPGTEDGTAVSDLNDEQLAKVREALVNMSTQLKESGKKMPPPSEFVSTLSDDDLVSLLDIIKQSKGSIPGVENSQEVEVSSLSSEQLNNARTALMDMQQQQFQQSLHQRMEEMMQSALPVYAAAIASSVSI